MFFYDGLNLEDVNSLTSRGLIQGLTTNLTLVSAARHTQKVESEKILSEYVDEVKKFNLPLSIQVESNEIDSIIAEALYLQNKYGNKIDLFIKIPANYENLYAINFLTKQGIKINATCVTSFMQGKLCSLSGAKIVSFFWGKMYDQGIDPAKHVNVFKQWSKDLQEKHSPILLVGSVRQIGSIEAAFLAGADVVTTSKENILKLANQLASANSNEIFQNSRLL
jgi:transaldolase